MFYSFAENKESRYSSLYYFLPETKNVVTATNRQTTVPVCLRRGGGERLAHTRKTNWYRSWIGPTVVGRELVYTRSVLSESVQRSAIFQTGIPPPRPCIRF